MNKLMLILLSISLSGLLVAAFVYIISVTFRRWMSNRWRYYIWLIVILRLLLPLSPPHSLVGSIFSQFQTAPMSTSVNRTNADDFPVQPDQESPSGAANQQVNEQEPPADFLAAIKANLWLLWFCVGMMLLVQKLVKYRSFMKFIRAGSFPLMNQDVCEAYGKAAAELRIKHPPKVYVNNIVVSPMLAGILRPILVLPEKQLQGPQWEAIFRHELIHFKRNDVLYKWFVQIAGCIHWFNPAIYFVRREIDKYCELSCDEAVIKNMNAAEKKRYGDTLIAVIKNSGNYYEQVAAVTLNENVKELKGRLEAIMKYRPLKKTMVLLSVVLTLSLSAAAVYAGAYHESRNPVIDKVETDVNETKSTETNKDEPSGNNEFYMMNRARFQDQYIIIMDVTNKTVAAEHDFSVERNGSVKKVSFTDEMQSFSGNQVVLDAVYKIVEEWDQSSKWPSLDPQTEWHFRVTDISGPYQESRAVLAERFYQEDNILYFSAVCSGMDEKSVDQLLQKSIADDRIKYYSALVYQCSEHVDFDALSEQYYQEQQVAYFAVLVNGMSETKRLELLNRSYEEDKNEFFAQILYHVDHINYEEWADKAYQDNRIDIFSVLSYEMDESQVNAYANKAYHDDQIEFFSVLVYLLEDEDLNALREKAQKDKRPEYTAVMQWY